MRERNHRYCLSGEPTICPTQYVIGFSGWGAFAELLPIPRADFNLVRLPDAIGFVAAVLASLHALLHKRRPQAAFGWIAVSLSLPIAGPLLYYFFGINRVEHRARKMLTRHPELECPTEYVGTPPPALAPLARLGFAVSGRPLTAGNRVELFVGTFVGAITFSGSVVAFGKLAGLGKYSRIFSSAPVVFPGQHWVNLVLGLVMLGAGVLARKAAARGLRVKPWVKTSLAPGSKVVTRYLEGAGVLDDLATLGFDLVGYGCTTCIGNSGPLPEPVAKAVEGGNLAVAAVLSGNRNFEGRVNPLTRANYLASPPLVVAYALAGGIDVDLYQEPLGTGRDGEPVYLRDVWPSRREIEETVHRALRSEMFESEYADVFAGDERWNALLVPAGETYAWDDGSTYVKRPPFFDGIRPEPEPPQDVQGARVLALLGDSITTDHISPAGAIKADSPAGRYLQERGVPPRDFNSYGSRRGNHEVMMRGTLANIRLKNEMVERSGGWTRLIPEGEETTIYEAAMAYQQRGVPLVIFGGKEYGSGSSRDWAAKGVHLLGVKAVIVESFERIHRSNLIGMGVLPLQFPAGQNAQSLGLTGKETYSITGASDASRRTVEVVATPDDGGKPVAFEARVRIDTPKEREYYRHGGILHYVLRQLAASGKAA